MNTKLTKIHSYTLFIGGLTGLVAMIWQASERISMLKNPSTPLNCNLSPVVDCGVVLSNRLSALFGFPNAFIGVAIFSMLSIIGLAGVCGVKFNQAFKKVILTLSTILILFSMWFFAVSLYSIGKICIFCVVGWIASVPIFVYSFMIYVRDNKYLKYYRFLKSNHLTVIFTWYITLIVLFLYRFRDYYFS